MMNGINKSRPKLRITAFPRIHITLIGMNSYGYRINGGIGFSISDPKIYVSFNYSQETLIRDIRKHGFTSTEIDRLRTKVDEIKRKFNFSCSISCEISGMSLTHFGFGTSTATYLACAEALFILNEHPYDNELIRRVSSRGGTSGIGVNTYFYGGFIFDAGIPNIENGQIAPSSIMTNRKNLPLVLNQVDLPGWKLGLAIPSEIKNKSELEEVEFFKRTCPIEKNEVESILYDAVFGTLSAIYERDFDTFCSTIKAIQNTKWKSEERLLYGHNLKKIETNIYNSGAKCVGMSSLGPGLYFLSNNTEDSIKNMNIEGFHIIESEFNNSGRIIEYD